MICTELRLVCMVLINMGSWGKVDREERCVYVARGGRVEKKLSKI